MPPAFHRLTRVAVLLLGTAACVEDDWDPDNPPVGTDDTAIADDTGVDTDTDTSSAPDPALSGAWTSQGADISTLFASDPFNIVLVQVTFRANGSYSAYTQDDAGQGASLAGTYTVDLGSSPHPIVLTQTEPYSATSEGLYAVDSGVLTYEVVQTVPDYGFTPPSGSFGTTTGPNITPGVNVQTYRR